MPKQKNKRSNKQEKESICTITTSDAIDLRDTVLRFASLENEKRTKEEKGGGGMASTRLDMMDERYDDDGKENGTEIEEGYISQNEEGSKYRDIQVVERKTGV